ncbi:MAG: hypothetical protein ACRDT0_16335 [Pseudonocardiaceae bacterium]
MAPPSRSPSGTRKSPRSPSRARPTPGVRRPRAGRSPSPKASRWALLGGLVAAVAVLAGVVLVAGRGGDGALAGGGAVELAHLASAAPLLQLVTWPDTGRLVGVAPDGTVHASADGGTTWEQRGSVDGAPEALTADGDEIYVAIEGSIVRSTDAGRAFRTW